MPIVFPGSPADGDYFNVGTKTFIYNSSRQSWAPVPSNATTAAVEPTAKTAGMLWYNTTNNTMGVWMVRRGNTSLQQIVSFIHLPTEKRLIP